VASKGEYSKLVRAKIEELEPHIWMVKDRADGTAAEVKEEYYQQFTALSSKLELVKEHLQELEEAGEEDWEGVRAKLDGALSDLNKSIGNVLARMS
jgi:predicted nucleotide-binding protein (sugar kinase/HSP70/actin superfamily)